MSIRHLFNSQGGYIAFQQDDHLWSPDAQRWVGWRSDDDGNFYTPKGKYLGTIYPDDRLLRIANRSFYDKYAPYEPYHPYAPYAPYGRYGIYMPSGTEDVPLSFL